MSEPTPLSAEQRERLESIHPMWSHQSGVRGHLPGEGCDVFPCLTNRALATIDAQATEIAALKGALAELREYTVDRESIANVMHIRGYGKPPDVTALRERIDALIGPYKARVLAGKEAQR